MGRLEPKHWALIGTFLTALAGMLGGYDHWSDMTKPVVVMGIIGLIGSHLGAVFAGAPPNPNLDRFDNPGRRVTDSTGPVSDLGSVSESTRSNLP